MAVSIFQKPLYEVLPIGQQVIFTVKEDTIVATKFNVKFVAQIHIRNKAINLSNNNYLKGTFKTTPNNVGVGIFDLRPILETFIKSDNEGSTWGNGSRYKGSDDTHPIHLIDKYAVSENSIMFFAINFYVEYSDTSTGAVINFADLPPTASTQYTMFNGVIQYDDDLHTFNRNYGYDMTPYYLNYVDDTKSFLTTSPTTQYARLTDYGTLPFLNFFPSSLKVDKIKVKYYSTVVD
mgnify:FL=1